MTTSQARSGQQWQRHHYTEFDQIRAKDYNLIESLTNILFSLFPSINKSIPSLNNNQLLINKKSSLIDRLRPSEHRSNDQYIENNINDNNFGNFISNTGAKNNNAMRLISSMNRYTILGRNKHLSPTTSSTTTTTILPPTRRSSVRVTRSDLLTIHQMHAASLNGLAGQFVSIAAGTGTSGQQQHTNSHQHYPNERPSSTGAAATAATTNQVINDSDLMNRRPAAQSSSVSQQVVGPPQQQHPQQPPPVVELSPATGNRRDPGAPLAANKPNDQQQPVSGGGGSNYESAATANPYTSSPVSHLPTSTIASTVMTTKTIPTTTASATNQPLSSSHQNGNVLASFSPPAVRPHNALANAKYSLDGIIAVAIFGGFIFLGAIITILVIIIRR